MASVNLTGLESTASGGLVGWTTGTTPAAALTGLGSTSAAGTFTLTTRITLDSPENMMLGVGRGTLSPTWGSFADAGTTWAPLTPTTAWSTVSAASTSWTSL